VIQFNLGDNCTMGIAAPIFKATACENIDEQGHPFKLNSIKCTVERPQLQRDRVASA
jgi:hypothetical protein